MAERARRKENSGKKKKAGLWILIPLLIAAAVILAVVIRAVFFQSPAPELNPDHAPSKEEKYAETTAEETEEKMTAPEGGGAVSMLYQKEVNISLSDGRAVLLFQNPSRSLNDIVLQLVLLGEDGTEAVLAQSGTLHPGYQIEQLELLKDAPELSEGTYAGRFHVLYYDPDTAERAVLSGNIEGIEITVTK